MSAGTTAIVTGEVHHVRPPAVCPHCSAEHYGSLQYHWSLCPAVARLVYDLKGHVVEVEFKSPSNPPTA